MSELQTNHHNTEMPAHEVGISVLEFDFCVPTTSGLSVVSDWIRASSQNWGHIHVIGRSYD